MGERYVFTREDRVKGQLAQAAKMRELGKTEPFGGKRHVLTREDRVKGQLAQAAKKRELGMTVRERFAEMVKRDAAEIYESFVNATKDGDWRAAQALLAEAFGRPASQIELTGKVDSSVAITVTSALPVPSAETVPGSAVDAVIDGDADELDATLPALPAATTD